MSSNPITLKSTRRAELRALLAQISPEDRTRKSHLLTQQALGRPEWKAAKAILLFYPLDDEPDIVSLIQQALAEKKTVLLPRFVETKGVYQPAMITSFAEDLVPGSYGIPEPAGHCRSFLPNQLDFTLVPGLGFTIDGRRLGRGKGHYDRLLGEVSGMTCGVAFDEQVSVELPMEPHDKKLSCILTPTRWLSD